MAKKNFYAVPKGRKPGIYRTWKIAKCEVNGFPKAKFKGFATMAEAHTFFKKHSTPTKRSADDQESTRQPNTSAEASAIMLVNSL